MLPQRWNTSMLGHERYASAWGKPLGFFRCCWDWRHFILCERSYGHHENWGSSAHLRVLTALPPTYPLRHLLLTAEAWARSLCQPRPYSAFLMPSTPRPATQKAAQTREAHLEASLRPTAVHLLPQCV